MSKKPDEWMPLHIGDYQADTAHLTRDQHGAYILLLMAYWRRGGPLPAIDARLAAIVKATGKEWKALRPVMAEFFVERDGHWHQKRADAELTKARGLVEAKSKAGKAGAAARWQAHSEGNGTAMADALPEQCQTDAPLPSPSPQPVQKNLSNFVLGRGRKSGVIPMTDENKIALFQSWLADIIGHNGWQIVGHAADPASPNYEEALDFCKKTARANGKGWPHKWPAPVAA